MSIGDITIRKDLFDDRLNGFLTSEILEAIAVAETDREVVLTLDQAIAVAQVSATIRVAHAVSNGMDAILQEVLHR